MNRFHFVIASALLLVSGVVAAEENVELPSEAIEVLQKFDRVVEDARTAMLKAIDDQIVLATRNGDLAEVKLFQGDKVAFEERGVFPKSTKLKTACTKCRASVKIGLEKSRLALEMQVKERTKSSDIATAERIQRELDDLARNWRDAVAANSTGLNYPKEGTVGETTSSVDAETGAKKPMFFVTSATWGHNEMFKNGLERKDVTKAFSRLLSSGEEITINEESLGKFDPPIKSMKALNVDFVVGEQKLTLWMNGGTRIRLLKSKKSDAPLWGTGPLQFLSATWCLADGTKGTDRLAQFKDLMAKRGITATGYREFGEIEVGKLKVMKMKIQADELLLDMTLAEPSRVAVTPHNEITQKQRD